jgi:hypothetical protein
MRAALLPFAPLCPSFALSQNNNFVQRNACLPPLITRISWITKPADTTPDCPLMAISRQLTT